MSGPHVPAALRRLVEQRAQQRCEYCLLPAIVALIAHEVDHVIARKHGGTTSAENLALTCWRCNRHKGTDLGSFDPDGGAFSPLYNPRTQPWPAHFVLRSATVGGLSAEGRTTARLLQMNTADRVRERRRLIAAGHIVLLAPAPDQTGQPPLGKGP